MENDILSNSSSNISSISHTAMSAWFEAVHFMRNICIPVIVCVGLFGNTLSLMVFSTKSMRKSSSSVFLAALAFVDNIFLLCLVVTWVDGELHTILTSDIACKFLIYTTYVTSCLSVWFIVCFTFERFLAICFPLKSAYICSVFREKCAVLVLTTLACFMYNFSFWTTGMEQWGPLMRCSHDPKYIDFLNIVTWIDTFLTMVIPFFLIAFMNSMVLRSVSKCKPKYGRSRMRHKRILSATAFVTFLDKNFVPCFLKQTTRVSTKLQRRNPQIRVTRTLLFVSTTFLVLNLPSHIMRLYNLISLITSETRSVSVKFSFLQELTLMMYYTTFSCNFFLYTCFGRNFRHSLYLIIYCQSVKEDYRKKMLYRLSSLQTRVS